MLRELRDIVGPTHVIVDPDRLPAYDTDCTGRFPGRCSVVVRPGSAEEVAAVVRVCAEHGQPVVPQGGNTGLVGGGVARNGEVLISLLRLDELGEIDVVAGQVTVGAGVTLARLQEHAEARDFEVGIDFAARDSATIGGIIATNAGGERVLRYGMVRSQVVGIEAVMADGALVRRLSGLVKDNCGYHLPSLFVGSEGTLGIVTAARLRLFPRLHHRTTALIATGSVADAVAVLTALRSRLDGLEAADFFLSPGLELVQQALGLPSPFAEQHSAYLLADLAGRQPVDDDMLQALAEIPAVRDATVGSTTSERRRLWRFREAHTEVIRLHSPVLKLDVAVPLEALDEFVSWVSHAVRAVDPAARQVVFGHLAEGNVHLNILGVPAAAERSLTERILRRVGELGGSISAEHGVGTFKQEWVTVTRSAHDLAVMMAIKSALDPGTILNPGVLFPAGYGAKIAVTQH